MSTEDDNEFCCNWPGCFAPRKGRRKPRGWAHVGYTMCCPQHAAALEAADFKIEDGWACALSERGEAFLAAYYDDIPEDEENDLFGSTGSMPSEELGHFRRMAAAAGVKLLDWTRPGGSPGLRFLAEGVMETLLP